MNIVFARAQDEDVPELVDLQRACFQKEYDLYGECPAYTVTRLELIHKLRTPNVFVYKIICDDKIIGAAEVHAPTDARLQLTMICVLAAYQDRGVGQKAVGYIESVHNGVCWTLLTPEKNEKNEHFFKKFGYRKDSKKYRSDCLTLVQYRKTAKP